MKENRTIYALIPAYEPTEVLIGLAKELKEAGLQVVVVDDGSGADYASIFETVKEYAKVISYLPNGGKGHALKEGYTAISKIAKEEDVIVTLDSDGQHCLKDVLAVADAVPQKKNTLILGRRVFGKGTPLRSLLGNKITQFVFQLSTGLKVHDTQTGLRAFRVNLIPEMQDIPGERYEYEMNVLLYGKRKKYAIDEVVIETIYIDNNSGSHFNTIKDSARVYSEILKFVGSSLIGFVTDYIAYTIFVSIMTGINAVYAVPISNICARVISASVNFTINRKFVFKSEGNLLKSAASYFLLAAAILCGNTILLTFLTGSCGLNEYVAKLITELAFFAISFIVQRFIIFNKKNPEDHDY